MPFHCLIKVRGPLSADWSERLHCMRITAEERDGYLETTLEGVLPDQAALQGVIASLGDLNLGVISVQTMDETAMPNPQS